MRASRRRSHHSVSGSCSADTLVRAFCGIVSETDDASGKGTASAVPVSCPRDRGFSPWPELAAQNGSTGLHPQQGLLDVGRLTPSNSPIRPRSLGRDASSIPGLPSGSHRLWSARACRALRGSGEGARATREPHQDAAPRNILPARPLPSTSPPTFATRRDAPKASVRRMPAIQQSADSPAT